VWVEPLAWWVVLSWVAVVAAGVLRVALLEGGVGDELGVAAISAALATTLASGEAVVLEAIVGPDGATIVPLAVLII
jgi:hypothetical protein